MERFCVLDSWKFPIINFQNSIHIPKIDSFLNWQNVLKMRVKHAKFFILCLNIQKRDRLVYAAETEVKWGVGFARNKGVIKHMTAYIFLLSVAGHGPLSRAPQAGFDPRAAIWEGLF